MGRITNLVAAERPLDGLDDEVRNFLPIADERFRRHLERLGQ